MSHKFNIEPKHIPHTLTEIFLASFLLFNSPTSANLESSTPPCQTLSASGLQATTNPYPWPEIVPGNWIYVKGFSEVVYASSQDPGLRSRDLCTKIADENDRWCKNEWMCGYTYGVLVPESYRQGDNNYPIVVFLHGGLTNYPGGRHWLAREFHIPDDDPYILVIPAKLEHEWNAKKILDIVTDVKTNMRIDDDRIYLTGLSMGGRGTFIVAAALPNQFAAIMPLSPHHLPFSYVPLAPKLAGIPIWMSHGSADQISLYQIARSMKNELENLGADITFNTILGGTHCCWGRIYRNPQAIGWLLSQTRANNKTVIKRTTLGRLKNIIFPNK